MNNDKSFFFDQKIKIEKEIDPDKSLSSGGIQFFAYKNCFKKGNTIVTSLQV